MAKGKRQVTTFKLSEEALEAIKKLKGMGHSSADSIFTQLASSPVSFLLSMDQVPEPGTLLDNPDLRTADYKDSILDRVEIPDPISPEKIRRTKHGVSERTLTKLNEIAKRRECTRDALVGAGLLKLLREEKDEVDANYRMIADVTRIVKAAAGAIAKAEAELQVLREAFQYEIRDADEKIADIIDSHRVAANSYERFTSDLYDLPDMEIDDWPLDELGR